MTMFNDNLRHGPVKCMNDAAAGVVWNQEVMTPSDALINAQFI